MKAQSKTNLIHVNFRRNKLLSAKGIYNKNYDKWKDIRRADNPNKKIAAECLSYMSAIEFLFLQNPDEVIFDSKLLKKKSDHKKKQRGRFLKQIADLYNIKFKSSYNYKGEEKIMVFSATRTENSLKILENPGKFYEENGLKNNPICSQKGHYIGSDLTPPYIDNIEKEEEPLVHSSSFSSLCSLSPENDSDDFVATTKSEPAPQEPIIEVPTLATSSLGELAKVYQAEEIRVVTSKVVNCDQLEAQSYEKIVQLKSRILVEEIASISSEEGGVTTGRIDQIMQLKTEIFKAFDSKTSEEIMENCTFTELEPYKLGISIKAKFSFSERDKQMLKTCVHMTYGSEIKMVNTSAVKQEAALMPGVDEPAQIRSNCQRWDRFKNELLKYFPEKTGNHILNAWFDKLRVSEDVPNNRMILTGSTFYVDSIYSRFETAIEEVVKKMAASQNKVTLELHYENNDQRPIIYKPNGRF
jgi:hypothetical protein